jgi:hypothetical protein
MEQNVKFSHVTRGSRVLVKRAGRAHLKCPFCGLYRENLPDDYNWREHICDEVRRRKPGRVAEVLLKLLNATNMFGINMAEMKPLELPFDMMKKFPDGIEYANGKWRPVRHNT